MARWDNYYPPYVSVGEKKARVAKKLAKLKKKNPGIRPIIIQGRTIAATWWGKSWNKNLERYADYSNRIERGRSYVRHGSVLDLQIKPGEVKALVAGTQSQPYSVVIKIKSIKKVNWLKIKQRCSGRLESLPDLLSGKFPAELADVFMVEGDGLFPSPAEIEFSCSCPDWAYMCKHVAATLYGVGARLDEDPSLFFQLRKVKVDDLINQAAKTKSRELLGKAKKKSSKILDDDSISDLFGIVMDEEKTYKARKKGGKTTKTPIKRSGKKTAKASKKGNVNQFPTSRQKAGVAATRLKNPAKGNKILTEAELVAKAIRRSKKGLNIKELNAKTELSATRLYTIVHSLKQQGKIVSASRGVYIKSGKKG